MRQALRSTEPGPGDPGPTEPGPGDPGPGEPGPGEAPSGGPEPGEPVVVIAQDFLVQRGGAERVALALSDAFPGAPIVTGCYAPDLTYPEFAHRPVQTLWPDRIGAVRRDPRRAMPVMSTVFGTHRIVGADVVVCSSSGYAHGVRTEAPKLVYCHNPARWLYQPEQYFGSLPPPARTVLEPFLRRERRWDRAHAREATLYLANSTLVRDRIRRNYGIDAQILPPPAGVTPDGPTEPVAGLEPGFYLSVARARGYKNTVATVSAFESLPGQRLVVVGSTTPTAGNVTGLSKVSDAQMRWLYGNAAALIAVSFEDFGLTPVEAFGFGTPVLALHAGGYLDSCVDGLTGLWLERPEAAEIVRGVRALAGVGVDPQAIRTHAETWAPARFRSSIRRFVETLH